MFVPARVFVMIYGGLALLNTFQPSRGIADAAHLGGMIFGYIYLQGGRGGLVAEEIKYRFLKWKMNRLRRKFDVFIQAGNGLEGTNPLGRPGSFCFTEDQEIRRPEIGRQNSSF